MIVTHTFMYNDKKLRNYTMLYDRTKRSSLWAAFAMNVDTYPWKVTRADSWHYDPALTFGTSSNPDYFGQPLLSNSYGGGYTRGHQVASNDRKTTLYQMYQTDYYSNMTPQTSAVNSGNTTQWDNLETSIQNLGKSTSGKDTLYVVTGAIFGEGFKNDATDNNGTACPVPTQYYKCIMKVTFDQSGEAKSASGVAYLCDHEGEEAGILKKKNIKDIEDLTGFDFFTNIKSDLQVKAEDGTSVLSLNL